MKNIQSIDRLLLKQYFLPNMCVESQLFSPWKANIFADSFDDSCCSMLMRIFKEELRRLYVLLNLPETFIFKTDLEWAAKSFFSADCMNYAPVTRRTELLKVSLKYIVQTSHQHSTISTRYIYIPFPIYFFSWYLFSTTTYAEKWCLVF